MTRNLLEMLKDGRIGNPHIRIWLCFGVVDWDLHICMGHTNNIPSLSNPTTSMQGDPLKALHQLNMMVLGHANFKKFILSA
jgi:hypothetical protein